MQAHREKFAHEHPEAAVAAHRNDLAVGLCGRGADRLGEGISHRAVTERAEDAALAVRLDVACGPHVAHARIDREHSIVVRELIEEARNVLRVDRLEARRPLRVRVDDVRELLLLLAQHRVEERAVLLLLELGQQRADREGHIAVHAQIEGHAAAETGAIGVDLHNLRLAFAGKELRVREVRAEQDQKIALVGCLVGGAVAE